MSLRSLVSKNPIHVAVGVIIDHQDRVLISRRPDHLHQGGLWEFPGGKVDEGETTAQALHRELYEELGIEVTETEPLIQIEHDYDDKKVFLDVRTVIDFSGEAQGKENQGILWIEKAELDNFVFLPANKGIVKAIQLPPYYMITRGYKTLDEFKRSIDLAVGKGVRLIQFRAKHLDTETYCKFACELVNRYQKNNISILISSAEDLLSKTKASGQHLTSQQLLENTERHIGSDKILSASVHNEAELKKAMQLDADLVVISPVQKTASHPDATPIGWDKFTELTRISNCPVYALGGVGFNDLEQSIKSGAQGIAGITMFAGD